MCLRNLVPFLFFLAFGPNTLGQSPGEKLDAWSLRNPIEKVYLHLDREEYIPGQTIWLKGYLLSEFNANYKSTTLFVELVSATSTLVHKLTLPVVDGVTQGQLELPDTLPVGKYLLRAYTATMLNHDPGFIYSRIIEIGGQGQGPMPVAGKTRMEFFPEGGNFLEGHPNTIAFKITGQNGLPVSGSGTIMDDKAEAVASFSTYHDGMGIVDIDAKEGRTYYAVLKGGPSTQQYPLPATVKEGIVFRLMTGENGIHFEILQKKNDPVFNAAYMIGQMQHKVAFTQPFREGTTTLTGVIKTNKLSSGILHITVFNREGQPLAERLCFVDNKEYVQPAILVEDTISFLPRSKNHMTLAFSDTVVGSFSLSVTDPDFDAGQVRRENIISAFLLSGDLKGYIHNPSYYFSKDNDSVKYALDLVMMTNGWRRFRWEQLLKDGVPAGKYRDPAFVTLSGRVNLEGTRKPFADRELLVYIVAADSSRSMQLIRTDANGNYQADSLLFFGKANVLFTDIKGKKSKFVDIIPGPDSLNRPYPLPVASKETWQAYQGLYDNQRLAKKLEEEHEAYIKATGLVLSTIVLKSRRKSPVEELEEKYAGGAFSGDTRRTFDLVNTDDAKAYLNIFDFLETKVPGLVAGRSDAGDYFVYFRQMATISSMGNQQMDVFLDEVLTDANTVAFINPSQIAMVKVYSSFVGSSGGGAGGALAVYLKKGADYFNSLPIAGEMITTTGYSVIREFYSPDYSVPVKSPATPDHRMTIYWKPDIFVSGVNTRIPLGFYTNDRAKAFKVVIEGMTVDGKLVLIEKTVRGK